MGKMKGGENKRTVIIAGYPARVQAVANLLDQVGTGIAPIQVGVLDGSREFLARLSLCAPDAIVIFGGPFKGELVSLLKEVRRTTSALILVVIMGADLRYEELKKAGATEVFQKAGDISADEVVEQLLGMLGRHKPPGRSAPFRSAPRPQEDDPKSVPRPQKAPKPQPAKLQKPQPRLVRGQELLVEKPESMVEVSPQKTFVVPGAKERSSGTTVSSRIVFVSPGRDCADEGMEIGQEIVNGRRKVTLGGRSFFLPVQLCSLLKLLYSRGEEGAGLERLYGVGLFTFETVAVAVGNLRKQLVRINRRWGEELYCKDGVYYFVNKKKK